MAAPLQPPSTEPREIARTPGARGVEDAAADALLVVTPSAFAWAVRAARRRRRPTAAAAAPEAPSIAPWMA